MEVSTDIDGLKTKKKVGRVKYSMVKPGLILAVDLHRAKLNGGRVYNMIIKTSDENVAMIMGTGELIHIESNYPVESIHKFKYISYSDTISMVDISNERSEWLLRNDS